MTTRYALYAAPPPDDPLWHFGSSAIGYDAALARDVAFPAGALFDRPDWAGLTEEPRRYGFHGTLKAPFELAQGASEADLLEAAMIFAERRPAITLPSLSVALLKSFVALVPASPSDDLARLAADCVRDLDAFRAPMGDGDRARRLNSPLTKRQVTQLDRYGYPYIFDDFRFHMTLTGSLPELLRQPVRTALAEAYAPLAAPFRLDAVALFRQDGRQGRFSILARFPLEG
jgi:putative phosphonate metabolism protein